MIDKSVNKIDLDESTGNVILQNVSSKGEIKIINEVPIDKIIDAVTQPKQELIDELREAVKRLETALERERTHVDEKREELSDLQKEFQSLTQRLDQEIQQKEKAEQSARQLITEFSKTTPEETSSLYKDAVQLFLNGQLDEALALLSPERLEQEVKEFEEARNQFRAKENQILETLLLKGKMLLLKYQFEEAEQIFLRAMAILGSAKSHFHLGHFYQQVSDNQKAYSNYQLAAAHLDDEDELAVDIFLHSAQVLQEQLNLSEMERCLQKARLHLEKLPNARLKKARILLEFGQLFHLRLQFEKAHSILQEVEQLLTAETSSSDEKTLLEVKLYKQQAFIYRTPESPFFNATESLKNFMQAFKNLSDQESDELSWEMTVAFNEAMKLMAQLKDPQLKSIIGSQLIRINETAQQLSAKNPFKYKAFEVESLLSLLEFTHQNSDQPVPAHLIDRLEQEAEELFQSNPLGNLEVFVHTQLYTCHLSKKYEAETAIEKLKQCVERLLSLFSQTPPPLAFRLEIELQINIANIFAFGLNDLPSAEKCFQRILDNFEHLSSLPEITDFGYIKSMFLLDIGVVYAQFGNYEKALDIFNQIFSILDPKELTDPEKHHYLSTLSYLSGTYYEMQDFENLLLACQKTLHFIESNVWNVENRKQLEATQLTTLHRLTEVYFAYSEEEEIKAILEKCIPLSSSSENRVKLANNYLRLAVLQLDKKRRFLPSILSHETARNIVPPTDRPLALILSESQFQRVLGNFHHENDSESLAVKDFEKCEALLTPLYSSTFSPQDNEERDFHMLVFIQNSVALGYYDFAYRCLKQMETVLDNWTGASASYANMVIHKLGSTLLSLQNDELKNRLSDGLQKLADIQLGLARQENKGELFQNFYDVDFYLTKLRLSIDQREICDQLLMDLNNAADTYELGKVLEYAEKLLENGFQTPLVYAVAAESAAHVKEEDKYQQYLNDLLKWEIHDHQICRICGSHAILSGNAEEGLKWMQKALSIFPTEASILNNLSWCYNVLMDFESALEYAEMALLADPTLPFSFSNKAYALLKLSQLSEAASCIAKGFEYTPQNAQLFMINGLIEHALGDSKKARDNIRQAQLLNPECYIFPADSELVQQLLEGSTTPNEDDLKKIFGI